MAVALAGCQEPTTCASVPQYAVTVEIRDSVSGLPAAYGTTVVLRDGAFVDSVNFTQGDSTRAAVVSLGGSRPGRYSLAVTKPGYGRWERQSIVVLSTRCGVASVFVEVRLTRATSVNQFVRSDRGGA